MISYLYIFFQITNANSIMTSRLTNWLVDKDIYGHPVTVNYQGSDSFKTKAGALVTLCTYTLILFNLVNTIAAFNDGSRQSESQGTSVIDKFTAGPFNLQDNEFELTVIRFSYLPYNIGRLAAY